VVNLLTKQHPREMSGHRLRGGSTLSERETSDVQDHELDRRRLEELVNTRMLDRLINWLMFSAGLALLPIMFNALSTVTRSENTSLGTLVQNGELLLVTGALAATALGEILQADDPRTSRSIVGGSALFILALASYYFADISIGRRLDEQLDVVVIQNISLVLYSFSVLVGASAIAIREASRV
jgi:hypothetical protein